MIRSYLFPIFLIVSVSILFGQALKLSILNEQGMVGAGFLPSLLSVFIILLLLIDLFLNFKNKKGDHKSKKIESTSLLKISIFVLFLVLALFMFQYLGMLVSLGVLILFILIFIEKNSLIKSVIVSLLIIGITFIIFEQLLNIPLPKGLFA